MRDASTPSAIEPVRCWYQIFVDKFAWEGGNGPPEVWSRAPDEHLKQGGTLQGAAEAVELGYFDWLARDGRPWGLYLTPVHVSFASYHKYWPEDHLQVDGELGGIQGLARLATALRARNGALMADLVFNHTGVGHSFFLDVMRKGSSSSHYRSYRGLPNLRRESLCIPLLATNLPIEQQIGFADPDILVVNGRYRLSGLSTTVEILQDRVVGPFFELTRETESPNYECWWGLPDLPELNTELPRVQDYLLRSAEMYVEAGIRHFRLDVPDALPDAVSFWSTLRTRLENHLRSIGDDTGLYFVGEIWDSASYHQWIRSAGESGSGAPFDAIMNYPVRRAILSFLSAYLVSEQYGRTAGHGPFTASDFRDYFNRVWSRFDHWTIARQLTLIGSHDVSRLASLVPDLRDRKQAFSLLFSLPGVPSIYYGDEVGMEGRAGDGGVGARATMKWEGPGTAEVRCTETFQHLRRLVQYRDRFSEWEDGEMAWVGSANDILAFRRTSSSGESLVVAAPGSVPHGRILDWLAEHVSDDSFRAVTSGGPHATATELDQEQVDTLREENGALILRRSRP